MVFDYKDYRSFLKTVLAEKAAHSKGYSLRAFSERLQMSNSFLSEVLNAKKSLSMEQAFKIAVRLDLTESETQYLCLLVQLEQEKDPAFREEILKRLAILNPRRETFDLSVDLFKIIADWHHLAILELTRLTGFKLTAASAAERLSISKTEAELAIQRLLRLELLVTDKRGLLSKQKDSMLSTSQVPNEAFKKYHGQILEKVMAALQEQTPQERMSATDVTAIDSRYLPEVDRLSQEFSSAVLQLGLKSKVKDHVYALSVHFFKLSTNPRSPS